MPVKISHKVVDLGYVDYEKRVREFRDSYTKVGFPEGEQAAPGDKTFDQVVQIAAVHEFGAPSVHVPERSFLRSTYDETRPKLATLMDKEYDRVATGQSTARESLSRIGEWEAGKVKAKIRSISTPPLAPSTLAAKLRKGSNPTPLIDTGQMMQSVTHKEVING